MEDKFVIKKFIIRKLYRQRMWLHKHINIHNLPKGLPNSFKGSKNVKKAIEELIKENLLLTKPTKYGLEISLNPKKLADIEKYGE